MFPPLPRLCDRLSRGPLPVILLSLVLLAGCNIEHQQENATPAPPNATNTPPSPAPSRTWTDIPVSSPSDRLTIHYHRPDGDYSTTNLWTWDVHKRQTPSPNDLLPLGTDDFGAVFELDRKKYGESDQIGILPRLTQSWAAKDGTDRIWTPRLGTEVWITSGKPALQSTRPDLTPHLQAAYADTATGIEIELTQPVAASVLDPAHIRILDAQDQPLQIAQAVPEPVNGAVSPGQSSAARVTIAVPLDFPAQTYHVEVDGLGTAAPLIPRGLLDEQSLYDSPDAILGAIYTPTGTTFRVFAPTATAANVVLYNQASGGAGRTMAPMHPSGRGIWEASVPGDLAGRFYLLLPAGPDLPGKETLDPYATNRVIDSSRARITPPTPAPPPLTHPPAAPEDSVIYEMHVRDFTIDPNSGITARGLYLGWTQANARLPGDTSIKTGVDHLAELGVTHVQIMPVQDFGDGTTPPSYNWGYVTTAYFSPEGMYATNPADDSRINELKALITALHQRGIGVIMDVVYNHTSLSAPFADLVPDYYYRRLADGSLADGSACGNEFRSEAPMARKFILDSLKYWVREYGVDGFRFDLMALIDRDTMIQVASELRSIYPAIEIYGEPWMAGSSPLSTPTDKTALLQVPVGAFNDDFRNALKGDPDGPSPGFIQDGSRRKELQRAMMVSDWFGSPAQSINYMTCHDNLVLWDKLQLSMPGAPDELLERTAKIGYLVLLTSQGVPFMQGGEEFGRTKHGDNNSYVSPDSVNEIDWSLKARNHGLFTYVRDLIALRKEHPLFRLKTREDIQARLHFLQTATGLAYEIDGASLPGEQSREALVIVNPDNANPMEMPLPSGDWEAAIDENGATMGNTFSDAVRVPPKSGLVLFQQAEQ